MQSIRIVEFPACKMVSSGTGMFGQENFTQFDAWFSGLPRSLYPKDFLYHNGEGFCWLYQYEEGMTVPSAFKIVDFTGGLYAVSTDIDAQTDMDAMQAEVNRFLKDNGFERDDSRFELGNVITPPAVGRVLGYNQMDYYTPIRCRNEQ